MATKPTTIKEPVEKKEPVINEVKKEAVQKKEIKMEPIKTYTDQFDHVLNLYKRGDQYYINTDDRKKIIECDQDLAKEILEKAESYYNLRAIY